jgi:CDP-2,3-bis-(O-geranylgeranyl)-sn-glycerol synthase
MRYELFPALRRPIDGSLTLGGRRLFGDNKTWRGAITMLAGVVAAAVLLCLSPWYRSKLPGDVRDAPPLVFGLLLGVGMVFGELPNSFLKRRIGIAPGARRRSVAGYALILFDQADFVPLTWVALLPIWTMSLAQVALVFVVVAGVHLAINVIGYAIGARTEPI